MRAHVARQPMPVEQSILWKPLRDPHYVVASLQIGDGGRRKVFVRQRVLARVESLVRSHGRRTFGILLGRLYQCSTSGVEYIVIESVAEEDPVGDETEMAASLGEALVERGKRHHLLLSSDDRVQHVLGWYRGISAVEAKPSLTTAGIHASLFNEPWQVTLVVGEGASAASGAFFLRDSVNARWFYSPFYELLSEAPPPDQPKPTVIDWPEHYITAEDVRRTRLSPTAADNRQQTPYKRPLLSLIRSGKKETGAEANGLADVRLLDVTGSKGGTLASDSMTSPTHSLPSGLGSPTSSAGPLEPITPENRVVTPENRVADLPARDHRAPEAPAGDRAFADRPASRLTYSGLADMPRAGRDDPLRRKARSAEKIAIVDDTDQRAAAPPSRRRVTEHDDTAMGDDPGRFIEIARSEGFFLAGRFDALGENEARQTLWILNEPYSGLLLAIVASESEIIDAALHYNLQTDDAGLERTPFPEHRNTETKTIYARETCMDSLRARCHRLRATNALVKEWSVTPRISFLTPAEWESVPMSDGDTERAASAIRRINNSRIAELPAGIRSQFHLEVPGEAGA
jgi:hypothetical protein